MHSHIFMRRPTLFIDIDGSLLYHTHSTSKIFTEKPQVTAGVMEKLNEWAKKDYCIILTTARKESMRAVTEKQLAEVGIFYDQLVMGLGLGPRYIINDEKEGQETAFGITIKRDGGFEKLTI